MSQKIRTLRLVLQILLPVVVLVAAVGIARWMVANMEKPAVSPPPPNVPMVRVIAAVPQDLTMDVQSLGTVEARTDVTLSAQVGGRVVEVAEALRPGAFFAAGEVLLRIDEADFRLAVVQQQSAVARARVRLAQERAEAEAAVRAWQQLEGDRQPDALATRALFVQEAEAALAAAEAALARAELDLARTRVSLPFAGRVRTTAVDIGQVVATGAPLAQVYGTDFVEVHLPIPDQDVAFLDLPMAAATGNDGAAPRGPVVDIAAEFAGQRHHWQGHVVRTQGEIDRRTRQLTVIVRVPDPFARGDDRPPLAVGLFVEATIRGRRFDSVIALPRAAVRDDGRVLVLDHENLLHARTVQVLRRDRDHTYVRSGLAAGERVCTSRIETFVDGMPVQVLDQGQDPDQNGHPAAPTPAIVPAIAPANGGK
ncbi:MAG: efflux RND transporter periplasmic adaptor subunit [Planctomycetota bacterium]